MAQALGYVTKNQNDAFEGTLSMMSLKKKISIQPNRAKESDAQPIHGSARVTTGELASKRAFRG
jgi:uncharacterized protein (DUF736 family)